MLMLTLTPSAAFAEATRINETEIDFFYSEICGFPVRNHSVETLVVNDSPLHHRIHSSGVEHLTNVRTGATVTVRSSLTVTFFKGTFEEALASGKPISTVRGLNYVILAGPGKKVVSAGRSATKVVEVVPGGAIV